METTPETDIVREPAHPPRDADGTIPEERWIPMIPFDYDWMDRPEPRYSDGKGGSRPLFSKRETKAAIRASERTHGLEPLSDEEIERTIDRVEEQERAAAAERMKSLDG